MSEKIENGKSLGSITTRMRQQPARPRRPIPSSGTTTVIASEKRHEADTEIDVTKQLTPIEQQEAIEKKERFKAIFTRVAQKPKSEEDKQAEFLDSMDDEAKKALAKPVRPSKKRGLAEITSDNHSPVLGEISGNRGQKQSPVSENPAKRVKTAVRQKIPQHSGKIVMPSEKIRQKVEKQAQKQQAQMYGNGTVVIGTQSASSRNINRRMQPIEKERSFKVGQTMPLPMKPNYLLAR